MMRSKYRKIYIACFICFLVINIAAVFFVFKKYHRETHSSKAISKAKFQLSKVKEKLENLQAKVEATDSCSLDRLQSLFLDKNYIDSILAFDKLNDEAIASIQNKIGEVEQKGVALEHSISPH